MKRYVAPDDPNNPWFDDGTVDYDRVVGTNPLAGGEYPKMLYRPDASAPEPTHGERVATMTVEDEEAEEAAREQGWRPSPASAAKRGPGRPPVSKPPVDTA